MLLLAVLTLSPVAHAQEPAPVRDDVVQLVLSYCAPRFGAQADEAADPVQTNPAADVLMRDSADRPTVAEGSLQYAAALLMSGGDAELAARVIDTVLDQQTDGAFPWALDTEAGPEATTYVAPWLAYLDAHHADSLPADLRAKLSASLQPALEAVTQVKAKPAETERVLMKIAAMAMLESRLGATGEAEAAFTKWVDYTREKGIPILHNSSRMVVATAALNWIWLADVGGMKPQAQAALDYIALDMAQRFDANGGVLGGAAVGSDSREFVMAMGPVQYLLFAYFGTPEVEAIPPFGLFLALPGYTPDAARQLLADTPAGRTVADRMGDTHFTTYVGADYSLGTMTGPVESGCAPLIVSYPRFGIEWQETSEAGETTDHSADISRNLYCDLRPIPGRVSAVQSGPKAIVSFDFDEIGETRDRIDVFVDLQLGPEAAIDAVYLNQSRYDADFGASVPSRASVVTERSGVYTAITVIELGAAAPRPIIEPAAQTGTLGWVPTGNAALGRTLVLRLPSRVKLGAQKARDNYRVSFAIEVGDEATYGSLDNFLRHIYGTRVKRDLKATKKKIGEKTESANPAPGIGRPVERAQWIYDTSVLQELEYVSETDSLVLHDDLEKNQVALETVGGFPVPWDFIYWSGELNQMPGDDLASTVRPPTVAEVEPESPAPEAEPPAE